ncbi:UDP-glucosyltransferase 2-like isoform X1 [Pieris brassicae]|uniref:UDP-glucosyltransferase 2-like isoform X1 n=2 Tax=Pieris brassicae TaxID=7116 RepID=UPI001E66243B|nr:UDP-glucosyltransferase 2-like isoform X1 [Pieris brassicae]
MMELKIFLLGVLLFTSYSDALRLLVFFPMPAKSHSILGHGVVDNLLAAGHEIVHITSFPKEKTVPNLMEINVSKVGERIKKSLFKHEDLTLRKIAQTKLDPILLMGFIYEVHRQVIDDPGVLELFENPNHKFDGVIIEWFFSKFVAGIAPLFKSPLIWVATTEAHWQVLEVIDGPSNPAYNVDLFSTNSLPLNLFQRTEELYTMVKRYILYSYYITPKEKNIYESALTPIARKRGVTLPTFDEAAYNASLLLITSHPSIGTPYKLPQNAKFVAGYHISTVVKPLPQDLKKLIDNAKNGVVYFSMGSNLKSSDMSEKMKNDLLKMFAKLYETVIWKFEDDLENVPKNVHLVKWAPQQSILAHPNLKFFITHGGQLSTTEAIHFGVPVIGIPILGDQYVNMNSVSNKGFGITVKWSEDSIISDLTAAIKEINTNPIYTTKAKELSEIYHNRQVSPGKDLVYWVEYVIATSGALHLRSPGLSLPLYKKLYLDLLALIIIVVYFLTKKLRPIICKRCRRRPGKKEKSK